MVNLGDALLLGSFTFIYHIMILINKNQELTICELGLKHSAGKQIERDRLI